TTLKPDYVKQARWHFLNAPTVSGNSWVETVGASRLFGQTFSTAPLTTSLAPVQLGGVTVQEVITQNASPTASLRYVTAFQVATAATSSMVPTQQVLSSDGQMEGTQMADQVVLFGRNGAVSPVVPVTYQVSGTTPLHHLLTDLKPGQVYHVRVNGAAVATVTASSQGTV